MKQLHSMSNLRPYFTVIARPRRLGKSHVFLASILFVFVSLTAAESKMASASPLSFQTVAKGYRSGIRESLQTVIRNRAEWQKLWQKHVSIQSNSPPPPAMDFSNELIIAVFLGEKPTGGYEIEITSAQRSDSILTVSFIEKRPKPGGMQIQALTQPFHIARVASASAEKVIFRRLP